MKSGLKTNKFSPKFLLLSGGVFQDVLYTFIFHVFVNKKLTKMSSIFTVEYICGIW